MSFTERAATRRSQLDRIQSVAVSSSNLARQTGDLSKVFVGPGKKSLSRVSSILELWAQLLSNTFVQEKYAESAANDSSAGWLSVEALDHLDERLVDLRQSLSAASPQLANGQVHELRSILADVLEHPAEIDLPKSVDEFLRFLDRLRSLLENWQEQEHPDGLVARANEAVSETEAATKVAATAAGKAGDDAMSSFYANMATTERGAANTFRWLTVFISITAGGGALALLLGSAVGIDIPSGDYVHLIQGGIFIAAVFGLAGYFARQAHQHRSMANWAGSLAVQLQTFEAYLSPIDDTSVRNELRQAFAARVFGDHPAMKGEQNLAPSNGRVAKGELTLNVKEYSVVGDGVADDTVGIQAAITAASGRTLYFPKGTYLASQLSFPASVDVTGEPGSVLKQLGTSNKHFLQITQPNVSLRVSNITIDQNNSGQTLGSGMFLFNTEQISASAEFQGVTFRDFCEGAIRILGNRSTSTRETLKVSGCKFRGGTESESSVYDTFTIFAANASELIVLDSDFDHGLAIAKQGIPAITVGATLTDIVAYTEMTVRNNRFKGYGRFTVGSGVGVIEFYAWGESLDISGNKFYDSSATPIRGKVNVKNGLISGNHLTDFINRGEGLASGIALVAATLSPTTGNVEISSNIIKGAPDRGIDVSNGTGTISAVRVHDNEIDGAGKHGICLTGLTDFNVHDNIIKNTTQQSIGYSLCAGSGRITNNIITGSTLQGICNVGSQTSLDLHIEGNQITGATASGITVEEVRYLSLQGNTVKDTIDGGASGQRGYRIGGTAGIPVAHIKNNTALGAFASGAFSVTGGGIATRYEHGNSWNGQVSHASAAPTVGTFARGDVVWNTLPVAGGSVGWSCVTAGTPGVWKTFGAITA